MLSLHRAGKKLHITIFYPQYSKEATGTFSTPCGTPSWRRTDSRIPGGLRAGLRAEEITNECAVRSPCGHSMAVAKREPRPNRRKGGVSGTLIGRKFLGTEGSRPRTLHTLAYTNLTAVE